MTLSKILGWLTIDCVCSWCHGVKHRAPLFFLGNGQASHGVCRACSKKFLASIG